MPRIVLTTLNARYAHTAFGLRYLMANLGSLRDEACILEFDINQRPLDIMESIVAAQPTIVGIGVYIWNVEQTTKLVADLKRLRSDITVILGGPEVSYETDQQEIAALADYVITGEGDVAFAQLCGQLLSGKPPAGKIIAAGLPQFATADGSADVRLPYDLYDDRDITGRVIYVEASRGCPFKCEFCLSSLDVPVRNVPLDDFLAALQRLLDRGALQFKFVDRTFNLNLNISLAILEFFLQRYRQGLFLHFEMIPDRLPQALRQIIARFPAGALQFEVGVQTFNEAVAQLISRRQDNEKVADNLRFLRQQTAVHIHADLIAGLPGEDLESFARGFDRLHALQPQEIQVGILKRLRGTPIVRHDVQWQMVYCSHAPYEVLSTKLVDFPTLQRLRRFARFWDTIANSGNFIETLPVLLANTQASAEAPSAFAAFMSLSDWLYTRLGRNHGVALVDLAALLFQWLTEHGQAAVDIAQNMWRDYQRSGRSDRPAFLRPYVAQALPPRSQTSATKIPKRQSRHLAAALEKCPRLPPPATKEPDEQR